VVLVGAGHAHIEVLVRLKELLSLGAEVTVINPRPEYYYSGMGPGMLAGTYGRGEACMDVRAVVARCGARFLVGRVRVVDPERRVLRLAGGGEIEYDIVSFGTGAEVPVPGGASGLPGVYTVKPISRLRQARKRILSMSPETEARLAVIGGGAAGVELAGNLWKLLKDHGRSGRIALISATRLLPAYSRTAGGLARRSLESRAVTVREGVRVVKVERGRLDLSDGTRTEFDVCLVATGVRAAALYGQSGLPTGTRGDMKVESTLACVGRPHVLGGGDCIAFDPALGKTGVIAREHGRQILSNLKALIKGRPLRRYRPRYSYLLILNLGDRKGLLLWRGIALAGRPFFRLKDAIDRRYVGQLSRLKSRQVQR